MAIASIKKIVQFNKWPIVIKNVKTTFKKKNPWLAKNEAYLEK